MKFLVVGCGSIGKRHIRNLLQLNAGEIIAYDVQPDRREEVQKQFDIAICEDFTQGLDQNPDAILVCTPTSLHLRYAHPAVERGLHVFVEKPLSDSLDGVDSFLAEVARRQVVVLVGCNYRFHRGLVLVKQLLDEGGIGRPLFVRAQFGQYLPDWHPWEDYRQGYSAKRSLGGGIILDSIHELDYVTWFLGEATEVCCFAGKVSDLEIETEDTAEILLRFENGALGEVHMDYVQRAYNRSCEVVGEEGTIVWSYQDNSVSLYSAVERRWHVSKWPGVYDTNEMYVQEMEHFLACLKGEEQPQLDEVGAKRVLQLALAAKESAQRGRKIVLKQETELT